MEIPLFSINNDLHKKSKKTLNLNNTPENCPVCGTRYINFSSIAFKKLNNKISIIDYCKHCDNFFIINPESFKEYSYGTNISKNIKLNFQPSIYDLFEIPKLVREFSPDFFENYIEAFRSEIQNFKITPYPTYRKALEYLINDYCIKFENITNNESFKKSTLVQKINNYIKDENIKTLAIGCAYLGNDNTHPEIKHPEYSPEDLKRFIKTFVNYVEFMLTVQEAKNLKNKKLT